MIYQYLELVDEIFHDNVVSIKTIGDGSCFFHAFVMAYFKPYQREEIDRKQFIRDLRNSLADKLAADYGDSISHYDKLSRGKLSEMSVDNPELSLEYMQQELRSDRFISNTYNEFISNLFNKDLYIIHKETGDIYVTGSDIKMMYLNRDSIVILYDEDQMHFELVGIEEEGVKMLFAESHPFIQKLLGRYKELITPPTQPSSVSVSQTPDEDPPLS